MPKEYLDGVLDCNCFVRLHRQGVGYAGAPWLARRSPRCYHVRAKLGGMVDPSDRETSARQTSESTGTEEFGVLALGLFSRTAVSVEYRPGCSFREPSAEALIDRAWQTCLRTSSEAGIIVYNGTLFRLDSFELGMTTCGLALGRRLSRCIGTASAEFRSAFPDLPRANPLAASVALVTGDRKIIIEKRSRIDSRRRAYHVIAGYMERERL